MTQSWQSGYCLCLISKGVVIQKINGFSTLKEAKQFLRFEWLAVFKTEYPQEVVSFQSFCENEQMAGYFPKADVSFIQVRPSVWNVLEARQATYQG